MVWRKITYYAMLTPERQYEIQQEIRVRQATRVARIAARLPPDSPEPEEEEEQPGEEEGQELASMEVEEAEEVEQPEPELPGFNMEQAEAEFAVAQSEEMVEQQAILESIQDEAYMEANRAFLRQEQAASDALFTELDAEIEEEEAGAEQPKAPEEPELQLPPMLPEPGTEIVDISDEE